MRTVRAIIAFLLVSEIVIAVAPTEKYRKYIRLFSSLVMILITVQPIMGIVNEFDINSIINKAGNQISQIIMNNDCVLEGVAEIEKESCERRLLEELKNDYAKLCEITRVELILDGNSIDCINIYAKAFDNNSELSESLIKEIKKNMVRLTEISADRINVCHVSGEKKND